MVWNIFSKSIVAFCIFRFWCHAPFIMKIGLILELYSCTIGMYVNRIHDNIPWNCNNPIKFDLHHILIEFKNKMQIIKAFCTYEYFFSPSSWYSMTFPIPFKFDKNVRGLEYFSTTFNFCYMSLLPFCQFKWYVTGNWTPFHGGFIRNIKNIFLQEEKNNHGIC